MFLGAFFLLGIPFLGDKRSQTNGLTTIPIQGRQSLQWILQTSGSAVLGISSQTMPSAVSDISMVSYGSENGVYPETAMFIRTWTNGFWGTAFWASIRSVIISQILLQIRRYPKILLFCHMFAMKIAILIGIVSSPFSDTPELEVVAWLCVFHYISYSR